MVRVMFCTIPSLWLSFLPILAGGATGFTRILELCILLTYTKISVKQHWKVEQWLLFSLFKLLVETQYFWWAIVATLKKLLSLQHAWYNSTRIFSNGNLNKKVTCKAHEMVVWYMSFHRPPLTPQPLWGPGTKPQHRQCTGFSTKRNQSLIDLVTATIKTWHSLLHRI